METKPLVTCHGDQSLFSLLHPTILQGLPRDPIEWRRSYGRPPKTVRLEASFVPFDSDILPLETDRTLVSRPFFHIYWTDCDLESYKQVVREEMMEWQAALKNYSIPDWLIVVVVSDESKVKTKLLPRSSVIDKVRSDFCNKQQDRCIVLYEPSKSESKSLDSWGNFYQRVRQLLLQACTRTLGKYEDRMRAFREKRNEAGWNFVEYFLVQEELAFMFEMMGVFEDALVQYDELDALFTQFVLNQAAGGTADWLSNFSQPCLSWAGLSLAKALDRETRDLVKQNKATLLEFRNYLFSRQCALLFLMGRPGEVAQRAMEYLHNTVQEMDILEINLPAGAVACWVFLSALEILSECEKYCDSSHITPYSLYTATLWDYARKKLKELGYLCGLMPGRESEPTSKQLTLVVDLLGGMGSGEETGEPRPMDKLREALSSKDTFQKHYLELSELAMGTFKHIGRLRSARLIGKDLADFYMNRGEPQKAEPFLVDALKMYKHEGWDILAEHIRLDIARCQEKLDNKLKLLRTACHIACCSLIPAHHRSYYQQVLTKLTSGFTEESVLLKAQSGFVVKSVTVQKPEVVKGDTVEIELCLHSKFVEDIVCDNISVAVSLQPPDFKPDPDPTLEVSPSTRSHKRHASRQDSNSSAQLEPMMTFHSIKSPFPAKIDIVAKTDRKDTLLQTCGLSCPNSHSLLKRIDSGVSTKTELLLGKEDCTGALTAQNVTLRPGLNDVLLTCKAAEKGVLKLNQLCVQIRGVDFLKSPVVSRTFYRVVCDEPSVQITPVQSECLVCGIEQAVTLTLYTGSVTVPQGATLTALPCPGLTLVSPDMKDNVLQIPGPAQPQSRLSVSLSVMAVLPKPKKTSMDYKLTFEGSWLPQGKLTASVTFLNPFRITHKLHTAKDKKFLQVLVTSETETEFSLTEPLMTAVNSQDVELVSLNRPGASWKVTKVQKVSYLWQLKNNISESPPLDFRLSFSYTCLLDEGTGRECVYSFTLDSYQTLYSLQCEVLPQGEEKACRVGSACCLRLHLTHMSQPLSKGPQLLYEITPDSSVWAVEGKTTGVFSSADVPYKTELQATPLMSGYLPYPFVTIHLYLPPDPSVEDVWVRRDSDEGGEVSSQPRTPTDTPHTKPFSVGQVYYSSIGKQVQVYPVTSQGEVEVSMA